MSMITVTVTPDDGDPFEVKAGTRDVYVWEKTSRDKTFARLMADMTIVDLYEIAHIAARRQGLWDGSLQHMVETCEIKVALDWITKAEDDDDKAGPFPQARSSETASPSPSSPASRHRSGQKKATGS